MLRIYDQEDPNPCQRYTVPQWVALAALWGPSTSAHISVRADSWLLLQPLASLALYRLVPYVRARPAMKFIGLSVVRCCPLLNVAAIPSSFDRPSVLKSFKGHTRPSNAKRVGCDKLEKYSVDWFIDNAPAAKRPKPATCLFYTR